MLFASLYLEREPLNWAHLPESLVGWLQNAGGAAAFAIALVLAPEVRVDRHSASASPTENFDIPLAEIGRAHV